MGKGKDRVTLAFKTFRVIARNRTSVVSNSFSQLVSFSPLLFAVGQKTDKAQMKLFHFTYGCVLSHVQLFATVLIGTWWPYGLEPPQLSCPWDFPGKNTGVGCHFLHQGIFPPQGVNPHLMCLLHCRYNRYHLSHQGSHFSFNCLWVVSEVS